MYRLMLAAAALAAAPLAAFAAEPGGTPMAEPIGGVSQEQVSSQDRPSPSATRASEPRAPAAAAGAGDTATPPRNPDGSITVTGAREAERRRAEENRTVCRREVRTGSMMPTTTCRSAAEWARIRERSIEQLDRMRADRRSRDHTNANRDAGK
jgi:hypothetical protein